MHREDIPFQSGNSAFNGLAVRLSFLDRAPRNFLLETHATMRGFAKQRQSNFQSHR